jgi:hypothetical protein
LQLSDEFAQQCLDDIEAAKEQYAQARGVRERADKAVTIALARITRVYLSGGEPFVKAQNTAKTHPDFERACNEHANAVTDEVRTEWTLKLLEMKFAAWRTISSNKRANL